MRVLLDTHVFLWAIGDRARLSSTALDVISDERNELLISAASLWEIALKVRAGKLRMPEESEYFARHMSLLGVQTLAVEGSHVLGVLSLPDHHRDPFDRLLISQCRIERLPILTVDRVMRKYAVKVLW